MRMQAQFLARLVSVASLDALPEEERARFLTVARRAGFTCGDSVDSLLWVILQHTHEIASPLMRSLLDGKETSLQPLGERERRRLKLIPKTGRVMETNGSEYFDEEMLLILWSLLGTYQAPFPFRRCPHCKTGVFFCFGTRKYCSPQCTSKAHEDARRGKRNEYMRTLTGKKTEKGKSPCPKTTPTENRLTSLL